MRPGALQLLRSPLAAASLGRAGSKPYVYWGQTFDAVSRGAAGWKYIPALAGEIVPSYSYTGGANGRGVIDLGQERARLAKELDRVNGEIGKLEKKLGNAGFVAKAPPEVVEEQRQRLADASQARAKLSIAVERLAGL